MQGETPVSANGDAPIKGLRVLPLLSMLLAAIFLSTIPFLSNNSQRRTPMRISIIVALTSMLFGSQAPGSMGRMSFPSYFSYSDLSFTPPGAMRFGLYGYDNPAMLAWVHQPDVLFTWSDAGQNWNDFNRWGLFAAAPHMSFGMVKTKSQHASIIDYRIGFGFGSRSFSLGFGFGWVGGNRVAFGRTNSFTIGTLFRPNQYASLGLVGTTASSGDSREAVADLTVRPLGTPLVALFADYAIRNGQSLHDGGWSAGLAIEPVDGLRLISRYFETEAFTMGIEVSLGRAAVSTRATYKGGSHVFTTHALRLGAYDRTVLAKMARDTRFLQLDLNGSMKYRRFILFDQSNTLLSTLEALDAAKEDPAVAGVVINTSGMNANREMLWEIREKLRELKSAGKRVVVFVDRISLDEYHFASVADRIIMDPTGMMMLHGYMMGRTFVKGALEKIGLAFDEWRLFTYKSANESFSRDRMSEADREQRQKLVDDLYALVKEEVGRGRNIPAERFEELVNDSVFFLAKDALTLGLVDTLARWDEVENIVAGKSLVGPGRLARYNLPPDERWGQRPRIAVIYALGVCDMDEGITARKLVKDVDAAAKDPAVKAIVLRVDSPGGDGMASDYIAEAMQRARKEKPVIVSQGYVAASGGYWLSMYADTIVAAPMSITGSIGVAGGWFYNTELKDKIGFSTDFVKAGAHADLGFGMTLPLLGISIPDRNLTEVERAAAERAMRALYSDFVGKVSAGREMTADEIDRIGQGRVWSGTDALKNGLVDVLGGLETAIALARHKAGLSPDERVEIAEMPAPGLLDFSFLRPRIVGAEQDALIEMLRFRMKNNGIPLPVLPLEEGMIQAGAAKGF